MAQQEQQQQPRQLGRRFRLRGGVQGSGLPQRQREAKKVEPPSLPRRAGALGLRLGSTLASAPFTLVPSPLNFVGGAIMGAGEGAAELVEGTPLSPDRIAVEAVLGTIPMRPIIHSGKILHSMFRSCALSGF